MIDWGILKSALGDTFSGIQEHGLRGNLERSVSEANIPAEVRNIAKHIPVPEYVEQGTTDVLDAFGIDANAMAGIIDNLPGVGDNPDIAEFWTNVWNQGGLAPYQTQDLGIYGDLVNMGIDYPQSTIAGLSSILGDASGVLDRASGAYSTQGGNAETVGWKDIPQVSQPSPGMEPVAPMSPVAPASPALPISRQDMVY